MKLFLILFVIQSAAKDLLTIYSMKADSSEVGMTKLVDWKIILLEYTDPQ